MSAAKSVRVQTDDLRVGCVIQHPINDPEGTLLLAGGIQITEQIKEGLKRRNINSVFLHPDDVGSASGVKPPSSRKAVPKKKSPTKKPKNDVQAKVDALAAKVSYSVKNTGQAIRDRVNFPGAVPYDSAQRQRLTEGFNAATSLLTNMIDDVLKGSKQGAQDLASMATNYVSELAEDSGHVISTADDLAQCADISPRLVRMSILAMAIAIEMGFDEENVRTVGVTALVHDWGLFSLDERFCDLRANHYWLFRQRQSIL